jgi:molecular chaperone DnaK
MSNNKAIGIDLGSTMSEVAIIEGGMPTVILTAEGTKTFPSVVSLDDKGERKVGASAKRQILVRPKETINLIKRLMGRNWEEAQEAIPHLAYEVVNKNGWPYVRLQGKDYSPQEISSWIISALKKMAEDYCGEEIKDAVITVPALFSDTARQATKAAGELAGLNVMRIINEPTAAALASKLTESGVYMVTDFGGSTLDNSVLDFDADSNILEILASNGDTWCGGADIDNALAKYICEEYKKESGMDISKDPMAMQRIIEAAEKAKIELSSTTQTEINQPYIVIKDGVPAHLMMTINRAKFEQIVAPIVDKVIKSAKEAVRLAKEKNGFSELKGIILIGGSCRIPYVQERLEKELNAKLIKKADFDLAVAEGAAIQANTIVGGENADKSILLLDVTPISLGIETLGDVMTKLIDANTTIPTKKVETFSTAADNQPAVTIKVLQGERPIASGNKCIGVFDLDGIAPAPKGVPQIQVTFDIDANGILSVSAKDLGTGKEQHITINNSNALSQEEIDRIKADAEKFKAEDEKKKAEIDEINKAEAYCYSVKDALKEDKYGSKISEEDKTKLNGYIDTLEEAIKGRDINSIKSAKQGLEDVFQPIITKIYEDVAKQNQSENGQSQDNPFTEATEGQNPFDNMKFEGNPFTEAK